MLPRLALTFALAAMLCPGRAAGQTLPPTQPQAEAEFDAPAYIAVIDGAATLERDGRIENAPLNMPLVSGDRLRTTGGRLQVRYDDGGRLFVDERSTVDLMSDELVRLIDGRVRVSLARGAQQVSYRIDSSAGSVRIAQPGEYRVALLRGSTTSPGGDQETQLELAVVRGSAEIFTEDGATPVRAGERAYASAGHMPSYAYSYNSANMDAFDRWADGERDAYSANSGSAQYLPQDMRDYSSTFDQYGDWRYQQEYGYVWYPRVAAEWRPYYYGRWVSYPRYGWTWIATDRFGWPTHHYGRWGFSSGLWFWIPSSRWAPAYVSWGYAPDYVTWCPLGWNNRAVFSIDLFNVGAGYYNVGPRYYSAWTVVPRGWFGRGYAYERAVSWDRLRGERPRFSERRSAPAYDRAVSRYAAPIRYAGRSVPDAGRNSPADGGTYRTGRASDRAVQRTETPRYINRGDQIVRSQTGRPVAPPFDPSRASGSSQAQSRGDSRSGRPEQSRGVPQHDTAIARTAPAYAPGAADAGRARIDGRTSDSAVYRAPSMNTAPRAYEPNYGSRPYERAVPREQAQPPRASDHPYGGGRVDGPRPAERPQPQPMERAVPMERSAPPASRSGDRAIARPSGGGQGAPNRAEPRPSGGGSGGRAPAGQPGGSASHRGGGR